MTGRFDPQMILLAALYHAAQDRPSTEFNLSDLAARYGVTDRTTAVADAVKILRSENLIAFEPSGFRGYGPIIKITKAGVDKVEEEIGENLATFLEQHGLTYAEDWDRPNDWGGTEPFSARSAEWTGIEVREPTDPKVVRKIKLHIVELDDAIEASGLTNYEKARAKAITAALVSLINSPEPEWGAVARLLQSPALGAALNIAALAQLILGMIL